MRELVSVPLPQPTQQATGWGIMVHSTGGGIPDRAHENKLDVAAETTRTYRNMGKVGPHFAIPPSGEIVQFRDPTRIAYHAGVTPDQRRDYLTGNWTRPGLVGKNVVRWWVEKWDGYKSPQHLFPSVSPNYDYIAIELVPCGTWPRGNGVWEPVHGQPLIPGGRYTAQQYISLGLLVRELAHQHSIDISDPRRLLGHEDVNPITRPGWDPGAFREYFHWGALHGIMSGLSQHNLR